MSLSPDYDSKLVGWATAATLTQRGVSCEIKARKKQNPHQSVGNPEVLHLGYAAIGSLT